MNDPQGIETSPGAAHSATARSAAASGDDLALVLDGGGARSAYQVGVLRGLASELGDIVPQVMTGVSAGAINVSFLANHTGDFRHKVEELHRLWRELDTPGVFIGRGSALLWRVARTGMRMGIGWAPTSAPFDGMVDTSPLRGTLSRGLGTRDGRLHGIRENLAAGRLRSVALMATEYATGRTISFYEGRELVEWERPKRRGQRTELTVDHIMASAALPFLFPAVLVGSEWYGDGGMRLVAPLAPAIHLGARRLLVISTRYSATTDEARRRTFEGPPSPAQIAGNLFNAVFLDQLDQDALQLQRINCLLEQVPAAHCSPDGTCGGLQRVDLEVVRPSADLGRIANEFEPDLPPTFRFLTRNLGTKRAKSQDLLSTVMFTKPYIGALLELGEADGRAQAARVGSLVCV